MRIAAIPSEPINPIAFVHGEVQHDIRNRLMITGVDHAHEKLATKWRVVRILPRRKGWPWPRTTHARVSSSAQRPSQSGNAMHVAGTPSSSVQSWSFSHAKSVNYSTPALATLGGVTQTVALANEVVF